MCKNNANIMQKWCVYMFGILSYASNMLLYASVMVLFYILMLLYFKCLRFFCFNFYYASGIYYYVLYLMIPVSTTTMLLLWTLLSQNTNLEISWNIPSLMNWEISYSPIDIKRTLYILQPRVTFIFMLSYFNVGGRQIVFILY